MAVMPGETVEIDGQSVQDRNAMIPIFGGPLETLNAKFYLAADDGAYKSALRCMTEAVYYEAANEFSQGKRAVAQVILNRMRHAAYPNSVCGVVYEGANRRVCQFSFTCDGSLLRKPMAPQWAESRAVAQAALAGQTEKSVGTSTHYHADYVLPNWAYKLAKVQVIGTHIFYRFHGRVGSSQAFGQRWSGFESIPSLDFSKMRQAIELAGSDALNSGEILPGVPIIRDMTDRRADSDVGGRIDPSKQWRLSIPDPVTASAGYQAKLEQQNSAQSKALDQLAELDAKKIGADQ
ncbi:cell wall hydrolase [Altererythrobacter gangjinensis]|uniref:Cell wall hydrolase n=2 Tax=Pontixanthobacter gangjinensis TaxID=1028742 RepID=A0A6I4SSI0_9SPHN|nr:cell wall hydrolase [Pontixanthobacter gangjinensis]